MEDRVAHSRSSGEHRAKRWEFAQQIRVLPRSAPLRHWVGGIGATDRSGPRPPSAPQYMMLHARRRLARVTLMVATCLLLRPHPGWAQVPEPVGLQGSIGYSHPGRPGFGITGGLWAHWWLLVGLASLDVTLVPGPPNERYQTETFSNGRTVCRDHSTGEFAEKEKCGSLPDALIGAMVELDLAPFEQLPVFFGGGLRTAPAPGPYASLGYARALGDDRWFWFLRGALGRHFGQAHFGIGF